MLLTYRLYVRETEVPMATPESVVREFCQVVSKRDPDLLRPLLADEVVYHNVGMAPSRGVDDVVANVQGQWAMFPALYEFRMVKLAANGATVLTERVDVIGGEGQEIPVPVMGAFEVVDGRITLWRDYFDTGLLGKMMAGEDVRDLVP